MASSIHSLNCTENLLSLSRALSQARVEVNWFHGRVVNFQGGSICGSISLDQLALKIASAAHERMEAGDLTLRERRAGLEISDQLKNFYTQSDAKIQKGHLIFILFQSIQDFLFNRYNCFFNRHASLLTGPQYSPSVYSPREIIEKGRCKNFFRLYLSEEGLSKDFGHAPIFRQERLKQHLISKEETSRSQPAGSFFVEERQIRMLATALDRPLERPAVEMIESIDWEPCLEECLCPKSSAAEPQRNLGEARVVFNHSDLCAEGCSHVCSITLKDGRKQRAVTDKKFGGLDLFKATKDSINWRENDRSHFEWASYLFTGKSCKAIQESQEEKKLIAGRVNQFLAENFFY